MSLMQMLQEQLSSQALGALQKQTGADGGQIQQAAMAALPMLLGGLAKNAESEDGAKSLWSALDKDHDGGMLDNLSDFFGSGQAQQQGKGILGHVLGGRQQQVEQVVAKASGMNAQGAGQTLAALAPVVMGMIGKMQSQKQIGGLGQLTELLGQESQQLRKNPQTGGLLSSLMDADGDGDVDISDIMSRGSLLGRFFRK